MKIKTVCEKTGLTDRTVRYYIDEGLLSPASDTNHRGRRSFDFTDNDVETLNHISTLRKFGFSVSEIRTMITSPDKIDSIVSCLKARKEAEIKIESELLKALNELKTDGDYTMKKLAKALNEPVKNRPAPNDSQKWSFFTVNIFNKKKLIVLTDAIECMLIKDRLKKAGIPYYFKTTAATGFWGNTASIGAATRNFSGGVSHADMSGRNYYVYYFYVSRRNYDKAKVVIRQK